LTTSNGASNIDQVVSFNPDEESRTFLFWYDSDLLPSGDTYKEYEITVTAVYGND
jgi:hypothetical protein